MRDKSERVTSSLVGSERRAATSQSAELGRPC